MAFYSQYARRPCFKTWQQPLSYRSLRRKPQCINTVLDAAWNSLRLAVPEEEVPNHAQLLRARRLAGRGTDAATVADDRARRMHHKGLCDDHSLGEAGQEDQEPTHRPPCHDRLLCVPPF